MRRSISKNEVAITKRGGKNAPLMPGRGREVS